MENIISWPALFGGMLLGVSAFILLVVNGKIAGISGIIAGSLFAQRSDRLWRILFLMGMVAGGYLGVHLFGGYFPESLSVSRSTLIIAGLLVGVGTALGNGCTSGHGICGIGRLSPRSFVAVITFMLVAMLTVFINRHLL